jgi:multidrug efflux system membrane fusion protein
MCISFVVAFAGCQQKAPQAASNSGPPVIPVSHPVQRKVTDFVDFTGRLDAKQSVAVRPRVTGYLIESKNQFKEGSDVKKGDVLFEIDPRSYQAAVDSAKSQLDLGTAQLDLAKITLKRDQDSGAAIPPQQIDQDKASVKAAEARIAGAKAALDLANLNLAWTHVTAEISGRVSRIYYTPGNSVTAYSTLLTTIVSMDPMYAYFDIDERTYHRFNKATSSKSFDGSSAIPVKFQLEGEREYRDGYVDFLNNQENASTGTIAARGVFKNFRSEGGSWRLLSGMFVKIRLPIGEAHESQLIIDRAIGSDQGLKYVYVVDKDNKVQTRSVITGALQEDGLRVIERYTKNTDPTTGAVTVTGVEQDEWVVVGGLPQIRARSIIDPDKIEMPVLATSNVLPAASREKLPPDKSSSKKK